ncbi:MAG TPA: DinB family protein [Candidatus Methylomirabilis sp.]|nr:DinB family protein [Candidatus Methylomirabilis sp.]
MTEEELRIRGYLTSQAAKLTPAAIVEKVRSAMADLDEAARAVPPARFADRPGADDWSANDVMAHVLDADAHFGEGILSALDDRPFLPPAERREPKVAPRRTAQAWSDLLEQSRAALFQRVLAADPSAKLERAIQHGMFGSLNWRETLLFMRLHDLDHAGQLKQIAAALA